MRKIMCVGDSLTAGEIGYCYRDYLDGDIETINRGMNGDNTAGVAMRLKRYLNNRQYDNIKDYIIFVGLNDLLLFDFSTVRKVSEDDIRCFENLYEGMVKLLKDNNKNALFVSVSFVEGRDISHKSIKIYNEIIKNLAEKYGFKYCNIYDPMKKLYEKGERLTLDGSHFMEISAKTVGCEISKCL